MSVITISYTNNIGIRGDTSEALKAGMAHAQHWQRHMRLGRMPRAAFQVRQNLGGAVVAGGAFSTACREPGKQRVVLRPSLTRPALTKDHRLI